MSCDEAEALLPLVADGALTAGEDPALFAHLAGCSTCQRSLADHDLIGVALQHGAARISPRLGKVIRLPLPWAIASAACVAAIVAIGVAIHTRMHDVSSPSIEVVAIPGSTPERTVYVLRKGEQTVVLDPAAARQVEDVAPVGFQRH